MLRTGQLAPGGPTLLPHSNPTLKSVMKPHPTAVLAAVSAGLLLTAHGDIVVPTGWKQSNSFSNARLASFLSGATGMDETETVLYNQDGAGGTGETSGADNKYWMTSGKANPNNQTGRNTAMTDGRVWIVADLGAYHQLSTIRIWNFNWDNTPGSPDTSLNDRGVSQFDILVRNAAADTADGTAEGTPINLNNPADDATNALSNDAVFNLGTTNPWTVALANQALAKAPNDDTCAAQSFSLPPGTNARFIAIRVDSSYGGGGIGLGKIRIEGTVSSDTYPPLLAATNPADNAGNVPIGGNLVATFNETVQAGTGSITLKRTGDHSVVETFDVASSPQLTFASAQVTINPTANLVTGTDYYLQIDATAIKDAYGNFFAGIVEPDTTTWSFTTDSLTPLLTVTTPADDATNVPTGSHLTVTFDEAIQAGTGNITIKRAGDDSVVEAFDAASSARLTFAATKVTVDPTADLTTGTDYYVQIDPTAITDLSGNAYAGIADTTSWTFTTDSTAPVLRSFSPATPTLADPGTRLLLQFDEAVQAGIGTVTIHKAGDHSVVETIDVTTPGAVAANGTVAAVVRTVALEPDTAYYVNASAGAVRDLSGIAAAAITGTSAWTFTTTSATPIVLENFSGSGTPLGGSAADTFAPAITTAGGSSVWGAASGFLESGAVGGSASSAAYLNLGTYINDTKGTAAGKFDLTMTLAEAPTAWVSLGFVGSNSPGTSANFTSMSGVGSIIYRAQTGVVAPNADGELDMFGGLGNTNGVDGPDHNTGFRTLTVTLDLTPAGGYNGTSNFGTVTWSDSVLGVLGAYTYTASRNFGSILITQAVTTSTINALALYQTGSAGTAYADWIGGFEVGGFTGPADDFDHDGLANVLENLLGTSPAAFSPGLTSVSAAGGSLVFRHTLSATPAADLTGSYEWSADLVTWHASGAAAGGTTVTFGAPVVVTPGTPDLVEVTATVTGSPAARVFARFKAALN